MLAPPEGAATNQARLDYAAERLRLLYVGITRAKRDLIVTWNTGPVQRATHPGCVAHGAADMRGACRGGRPGPFPGGSLMTAPSP